MFMLMFLPFLPFAIYSFSTHLIKPVLLQLTLLINIVDPDSINPGVFWFYGLIMQFYIFFALLRLVKSRGNILTIFLLLNIISIVLLFLLVDNQTILNWVRHNFIGWLLPFSMGILFAKMSKCGFMFDSIWKNFIMIIVGCLLLVISNFNYYLWILSPIFAIFVAVGFTKLIERIHFLDAISVWLGYLSAYIFAVHPLVRLFFQKVCLSEMTRLPFLLLYVTLTILVSIIYKNIHRRFFSRWLQS